MSEVRITTMKKLIEDVQKIKAKVDLQKELIKLYDLQYERPLTRKELKEKRELEKELVEFE